MSIIKIKKFFNNKLPEAPKLSSEILRKLNSPEIMQEIYAGITAKLKSSKIDDSNNKKIRNRRDFFILLVNKLLIFFRISRINI